MALPTNGIGLVRAGARTLAELSSASRAALDVPLRARAELWLARGADEGDLRGAFERGAAPARGSGGPTVHVGPGTLHVLLLLARADALVPCDPPRLINRYVRPILRALTKVGATAHYFGRDWISVEKRPAGWVGFAHDATSGRAAVEAFVAVSTPFARAARGSFLGKEPGTMDSIAGRPFDMARVEEAIADAYATAYAAELAPLELPPLPEIGLVEIDPPWAATVEEAIGTVAAGRDRAGILRVGGELLASRDAIARLEARLAALPPDSDHAAIAAALDDTLAAPGVALEGVRSLASLLDVIVRGR